MILLFLVIAIIAASGESRSEGWYAFLGFVMLGCLGVAFIIGILSIL